MLKFWDRIKNMINVNHRSSLKSEKYGNFTRWFEPHNIFARKHHDRVARNEMVFAAITLLSNSMAMLPLKLYKGFKPISNKTSDKIMYAPNSIMTGFEFIRMLEVHRNTYGNGYAIKMYDDLSQVSALYILDPTRVSPVLEEKTKELWYEIDTPEGRYYAYHADIIHVKHIHSRGYVGISPIDVLKNSLEFDWKVRKFSLDQMDSSIKASFILKTPTTLGMDEKKNIIENFKRFYQDNGGVLIQDSGVDIEHIDRRFMDTKTFEVERILRARVASVFNIPPHMLGNTEGASFSSMEQQSIEFVQKTLMPIVRMYEQEFNKKLLTERERNRGITFKFTVNALLRGDMATRGNFYMMGTRTGWFTPNEVRAWEDLPPLNGGDKLYMSGDLSPIDDPDRLGDPAAKEVKDDVNTSNDDP